MPIIGLDDLVVNGEDDSRTALVVVGPAVPPGLAPLSPMLGELIPRHHDDCGASYGSCEYCT